MRSLTQLDECSPSMHADKEWAAGAGKTYTMEGTQENPGINYRTMKELFRCAIEASRLCLPILLCAFQKFPFQYQADGFPVFDSQPDCAFGQAQS